MQSTKIQSVMNKLTEKSLCDALAYCGLKSLPEADNKKDVWIRAIAKVLKMDGIEYFVYMEKDKQLKPNVMVDFGSVTPIVKVVEVYPYSFLKASYMPTFSTKKREESFDFLVRKRRGIDYSAYTLRELDLEITLIAIQDQLDMEKRSENN